MGTGTPRRYRTCCFCTPGAFGLALDGSGVKLAIRPPTANKGERGTPRRSSSQSRSPRAKVDPEPGRRGIGEFHKGQLVGPALGFRADRWQIGHEAFEVVGDGGGTWRMHDP